MKQETQISVLPTEEVAKSLQDVVLSVTGVEGLQGFQRAYMMAQGIKKLKELLTPEYMEPIMQLQGSRLGFRTDKDIIDGKPGPGYSMEVVKMCVIEAVLNGYEVTGNQFNIIAGNMYPTKEGIGSKLNKFAGLKQQIVIGLPRMNNEGTSAAVEANIKWSINGQSNEQIVPIPIRVNRMMGLDAVIGKSTRKARAWLLGQITGTEVTDGEVEDAEHKVISSKNTNDKGKNQSEEEIETQRWEAMIKESSTVEELEFFNQQIPESLREKYNERKQQLSKNTAK